MAPCLVLVDPSRAVQKAVAILLEAAGHVVTAFDDPCEALDKISTHTKRLMPLSPNDYGKLDSSGFGR
jgi:CheY-like chemotaxis protein